MMGQPGSIFAVNQGFVKPRKVTDEFADKLRAVDLKMGSELAENLQEGLSSIALGNHAALTTAFLNDVDGIYGFAQQVNGYGKPRYALSGLFTIKSIFKRLLQHWQR